LELILFIKMNFAGDVVVLVHWLGLFAGNAVLPFAVLDQGHASSAPSELATKYFCSTIFEPPAPQYLLDL
jgi:hypothetical protein